MYLWQLLQQFVDVLLQWSWRETDAWVGEVGALANFPDRHFVCYDPAFYTFLFATSGPCLYLFIFILDPAFLFSNSGPSWCSWSSLSIKSQFICFLVFLYDQTLSLYCNLQVLLCLCFRMRYTPAVNLCCPQKILSVLYTFPIYPYLDIPLPGYLLGIF